MHEGKFPIWCKMSKYVIDHHIFMMLTYHELQSPAEVIKAFKKRSVHPCEDFALQYNIFNNI